MSSRPISHLNFHDWNNIQFERKAIAPSPSWYNWLTKTQVYFYADKEGKLCYQHVSYYARYFSCFGWHAHLNKGDLWEFLKSKDIVQGDCPESSRFRTFLGQCLAQPPMELTGYIITTPTSCVYFEKSETARLSGASRVQLRKWDTFSQLQGSIHNILQRYLQEVGSAEKGTLITDLKKLGFVIESPPQHTPLSESSYLEWQRQIDQACTDVLYPAYTLETKDAQGTKNIITVCLQEFYLDSEKSVALNYSDGKRLHCYQMQEAPPSFIELINLSRNLPLLEALRRDISLHAAVPPFPSLSTTLCQLIGLSFSLAEMKKQTRCVRAGNSPIALVRSYLEKKGAAPQGSLLHDLRSLGFPLDPLEAKTWQEKYGTLEQDCTEKRFSIALSARGSGAFSAGAKQSALLFSQRPLPVTIEINGKKERLHIPWTAFYSIDDAHLGFALQGKHYKAVYPQKPSLHPFMNADLGGHLLIIQAIKNLPLLSVLTKDWALHPTTTPSQVSSSKAEMSPESQPSGPINPLARGIWFENIRGAKQDRYALKSYDDLKADLAKVPPSIKETMEVKFRDVRKPTKVQADGSLASLERSLDLMRSYGNWEGSPISQNLFLSQDPLADVQILHLYHVIDDTQSYERCFIFWDPYLKSLTYFLYKKYSNTPKIEHIENIPTQAHQDLLNPSVSLVRHPSFDFQFKFTIHKKQENAPQAQ